MSEDEMTLAARTWIGCSQIEWDALDEALRRRLMARTAAALTATGIKSSSSNKEDDPYNQLIMLNELWEVLGYGKAMFDTSLARLGPKNLWVEMLKTLKSRQEYTENLQRIYTDAISSLKTLADSMRAAK